MSSVPCQPSATSGLDLRADAHQIEQFLSALVPGVYEVRIPGPEARRPRFLGTQQMYLKLPEDLGRGVSQIAQVTGHHAGGVYIVGNPLTPALLGRGHGRFYRAKSTASDADVLHRHLLFIDIDSARPSAINATAEEAEVAVARARATAGWLSDEFDFPNPLFLGTSGGGGMILYRIDFPNTGETTNIVRQCLDALAREFDTDHVHIDTAVFNAARSFRVPGTVNAKSNTPQPDRPWALVQGAFYATEVIRG